MYNQSYEIFEISKVGGFFFSDFCKTFLPEAHSRGINLDQLGPKTKVVENFFLRAIGYQTFLKKVPFSSAIPAFSILAVFW